MSIVLEQLTKRMSGHIVVNRVNLQVANGELFVLLGASGSGKSTILRLVAGLLPPDAGRILIHDQDVTAWPPQLRDTGFVFQNYSVFRHMSVGANVEFGLRIRRMPAAQRAQRRDELLELVGLTGLGNRYAHQLSGGQLQRVALARALAYEPRVLLLDEPFGALDVKIRSQIRRSLKSIQRKLGITTILVTHDQEEAFELADRIGVIERGLLLEVGEAETLYARPRSNFVATFLGAGNVLVGRAKDGRAHFGFLNLPIPPEVAHENGSRVRVLFRPEQVMLHHDTPPEETPLLGYGKVLEHAFSGPLRRIRLKLARLAGTRQIAPLPAFGEDAMLIDAVQPTQQSVPSGEVYVSLQQWLILEQPKPKILLYSSARETDTTLRLTTDLADRMNASVTMMAVAADPAEAESLTAELQRRSRLAAVADLLQRVRQGTTTEQILSEQSENLYDMIVLAATDGKRGNLGVTVMDLLTAAEVPLLVARDRFSPVRRVLICTAAGAPGQTTVRFGGWLARRLGAQVTLLYVAVGTKGPPPAAHAHLQQASDAMHALEVPNEKRLVSAARPIDGILTQARSEEFDLVIVGSHGPQVRSVFAPEDVTLQVLLGTECPVVVVPADE